MALRVGGIFAINAADAHSDSFFRSAVPVRQRPDFRRVLRADLEAEAAGGDGGAVNAFAFHRACDRRLRASAPDVSADSARTVCAGEGCAGDGVDAACPSFA